MSVTVLKAKRITLGVIAGSLGVAGFILPIMPGWPFAIFAVFLLSKDVPPVRPLRDWMERRFPRVSVPVHKWEAFFGLQDKAETVVQKAADSSVPPKV
jgi:uncharacterized membrane protein YbaN (DUF454 family)